MMLWLLVVVSNASLSVTVPEGYRDVSSEAGKLSNGSPDAKDAIILAKGTPGSPDAASINFVHAEHHPEDHFGDAKMCAAFAEDMRQHMKAQAQTSSIVNGPTGKTCQIAMYYDREKMAVVSTILQGHKDSWMMTCAMLASNTAALQQCQKTLATVKLK
jgi:hypothetical protein